MTPKDKTDAVPHVVERRLVAVTKMYTMVQVVGNDRPVWIMIEPRYIEPDAGADTKLYYVFPDDMNGESSEMRVTRLVNCRIGEHTPSYQEALNQIPVQNRGSKVL